MPAIAKLAQVQKSVAILAGGRGTRLRTRAGDLPKPMVPIGGKPVLQHQIELCREYGFVDIALLVHYRHEAISDHFGDGTQFGVNISYEVERDARGTAGALSDALPNLADRFLVLYGDTYLEVDLRRIWDAHCERRADATLFLHPNDHPQDSDLVDCDRDGWVTAILPYPRNSTADHRNLVNAALYVVERHSLAQLVPSDQKSDIARDLFRAMLDSGRQLYGYTSPEYIKDMGTPERLDKVEHDLHRGLPYLLSGRSLRSAVFLDRDGTLNREVVHLREPDQLELLEGSGDAVRRLNRAGRLAVVVTNQPVVGRGDVSLDGLERIHARLEALLGQHGAYLDAIRFCPHHPDKGFPGEVAALKVRCTCRKPATGLIDEACREFQIDRSQSWLIGDSSSDIEAGRKAGLKTILLRTGHAGADDKHALRPDYTMLDLHDAVQWILVDHQRMCEKLTAVLGEAMRARLVLIGGLSRAGKSTAAQVLKEMLRASGRTAHVVSLDSWLQPKEHRAESGGVVARYRLDAAADTLLSVAKSTHFCVLPVTVYDPLSRNMLSLRVPMGIAPDHILIVEGVPALLASPLRDHARLRLFVHISETERERRLRDYYCRRGYAESAIAALIASRHEDEGAAVLESRRWADHVLTMDGPGNDR
jgi:histidinol-phosphate phosphatase family protein